MWISFRCYQPQQAFFFSLACLLAVATGAHADETIPAAQPTTRDASPDHQVVLRISGAMLNGMLDNKEIDRPIDIREDILGTAIQGKGRVVGHTHVNLVESGDAAKFVIHFHGEVHSRTTGYHGPAIIYSRAVTKFSASKLVVFKPGEGFVGQPTKVKATTASTLEGIASTRSGWLGRIVRRRAAQREAELRPQVTEIARRRAEQRIALGFEKTSEVRLAKLNKNLDNRSLAMVGLRTDSQGEANFTCCTTPRHLHIATKNCAGAATIELPDHHIVENVTCPIELWVHDSLVGERLSAGIDMLTTHLGSSDLVTTIAAAAEVLRGNSHPMHEHSTDSTSPLRVQKAGKWRVVQVAMPAAEVTSVVKAMQTQPTKTAKPVLATVAEKAAQIVAQQRDKVETSTATPPAPQPRTWTSGKYTADAEFVALEAGIVRLRRPSGVNTTIPLAKLSPNDQQWITSRLAQQ
ncbi:hypothetical protein ETAA8_24990 [Anatilimnocola aggregata]|uniref:SLA1 homology domain-containing protein n=1 Tax=Anatilimnocola aggregata TaxID=2528021 RepID=A0A517YBB8_9BACT|nr:SHD1 domain-containing protein [Anatilimnocola aggregata]QDU27412.1 hypothetical protein ETAA8_24990 [Anatilimnocola aggregata]